MVLRYDRFCFIQAREPPLDLQIFVSGNALHNPAFLDEQLEFTGLIGIIRAAIKACRKIDTPRRDPVPFYDTLRRRLFPASPGIRICHECQRVSHGPVLPRYENSLDLDAHEISPGPTPNKAGWFQLALFSGGRPAGLQPQVRYADTIATAC